MVEIEVLKIVAPLLERLQLHLPKPCPVPAEVCGRGMIAPVLGCMDVTQNAVPDAAIYDCVCGHKEFAPLKSAP